MVRPAIAALPLGLSHGPISMPASPPVVAQLGSATNGSSSQTAIDWISLDGYQVFRISAPSSSSLAIRKSNIERNLKDIEETYLSLSDPTLEFVAEEEGENEVSLYINGRYLMSVTDAGARMQGMTKNGLVENIQQTVTKALQQAERQRQPAYIRRAGLTATIAMMSVIALALLLHFSRYLPIRAGLRRIPGLPLAAAIDSQRRHLKAIRQLLVPLLQITVLSGAAIWSLGLFAQTRPLQNALLSWLRVPAAIVIIAAIAFVGVRTSYLLIDRSVGTLKDRTSFDIENNRRLELRVSTISSVIKNIANFVWIAIGLIVALTILGINFGVLLTSFGIIGLALSLAAQDLIRGVVTGFFILLEDQYAIGDVVKIDDDAGLVENMNLRITQLRDTGGRLITIPTSDITRVANYSLHWSRCDLKLRVSYQADIDEMIQLAHQVSDDLRSDAEWSELILEDPNILGVEELGEDAIVLRVWIKTQPLKQWDVSREFRRRYKLAIQEMETSMPFPQRQVWLNAPEGIAVNLSGEVRQANAKNNNEESSTRNGSSRESHNSQRGRSSSTDRQPDNSFAEDTSEDAEPEGKESDV